MKKIVIVLGTTYIILTVALVGYKITKKDNCYYNYKKTVAKAEKSVAANPISKESEENTDPTTGPAVTNNETNANANTNTNTNVNPAPVQLQYANVKFTQQLYEGKKGDDVKKLQEILKVKLYYTGEITGTFDNATKKALMSYQKDKNLYQDGVLGPGTWKTLE